MSLPSNVPISPDGSERFSLRARWVFPVWGPPLENGTVEITAGRISAVHDFADPTACDLRNVALIPGLVNAHTHLELSDVAAPLHPVNPFTAWLKEVVAYRRARMEKGESIEEIVSRGQFEAIRSGTTTLADITGEPTRVQSDSSKDLRTIAFLEVLGLAPERAALQLQRVAEHLAGDGSIVRGLSPHAPYSVHPNLFRRVIDLAVRHHAPVAMHLAETRDELELLARGTGPFVPFLEELGVWRHGAIPRGSRPLDYLRELARVESSLVIHGNYLDQEEIDFLARHPNLSVIYCPRTHAHFGHEPHPWRTLLDRGINLALGTDSRASNPDLSMFAELIFLSRAAPDLDPARLLQLGTWDGAFALGVEHDCGTLAIGKTADLAVVALPESDQSDPYALLFAPENRILCTIRAGRQVAPDEAG